MVLQKPYHRGEAAQALHNGLEGAAGAYFNGALINCKGCAAENLWNRPVSLVNRCSNDFLPENRKWFAQHILQACYSCYSFSGLFLGYFDMFWTDDGQAVKNCVVRAMSGGPIYVSDLVGRSVAERLLPLCFEDGRAVVGLINKYIAGGTFWQLTPNGYLVYGAGPFAFYSKGGAEKYFAKRPQSPLQKAG